MAAYSHFKNLIRFRRTNAETVEEEKRPRVGIAFSSGGAKGLAHIGVIQVLEENGIHVDVIAGTSMGAYVGGLWASGIPGPELEKLSASMTSRKDLWELVDFEIPPRRGFIGGKNVLKRLRKSLGKKTFLDLPKPFFCVATELNGYGRALLSEGDVASAIVASLAVPGIVHPIEREGVEYIDGGVCDPLPVNLFREVAEVDKIIAVNVLPKVGQTKRFHFPPEKFHIWKNPLKFLNQHLNLFARGNLLDILRSSAMGSQMRLVARSARNADLLIEAISPAPRWHDYNNYRSYIDLGREAATEMLPELLALKNGSDIETKERELELKS